MDGSALIMIGQSSAVLREDTKFSSLERVFSSLALHFMEVLASIKLFKQDKQKVKNHKSRIKLRNQGQSFTLENAQVPNLSPLRDFLIAPNFPSKYRHCQGMQALIQLRKLFIS